jgi:hypothetical protein
MPVPSQGHYGFHSGKIVVKAVPNPVKQMSKTIYLRHADDQIHPRTNLAYIFQI